MNDSTENKHHRIAYVRFESQGLAVPAICNRDDLIVGDEVDVAMYAGTSLQFVDSGQIMYFDFDNEQCLHRVICHICESFLLESGELLAHNVLDNPRACQQAIAAWREDKETELNALL